LYAQSNDNLKQETILSTWTDNPYNSNQSKWLEKNGFDTKEYGYNSVGINTHLKSAFKVRRAAYPWALVSALSLDFAIRRDGTEGKGINYSLILGSAYLSIKKFHRARKNVVRAESYRRLYMNSYQSDSSTSLAEIVFDSPYRKSQNNWMKRNGFQLDEYNWGNQDINKELNRGFKLKNNKALVLYAEVPIFFVYALAVLLHSRINGRPTNDFKKWPFHVAAAMPVIAYIAIGEKAKRKIREAEYLRRSN
jgi:hypothetical protein